jgi:hypothetical protein
MTPVGWDDRYLAFYETKKQEQHQKSVASNEDKYGTSEEATNEEAIQKQSVAEPEGNGDEKTRPRSPGKATSDSGRPPNQQPATNFDDIDDDDLFEIMAVSEEQASQRRVEVSGPLPKDDPPAAPRPTIPFTFKKTPPWIGDDPIKPLNLSPLRSIPNLPRKQNWAVNVLAVVASRTEVQPTLS